MTDAARPARPLATPRRRRAEPRAERRRRAADHPAHDGDRRPTIRDLRLRALVGAVFALKAVQGLLLLADDLPGVPDVAREEALRSAALPAICVGLVVWRSGWLTWSTCAAVALLSLVSNAAAPDPLAWSAVNVATSAVALAAIGRHVAHLAAARRAGRR